MIQRLTICALAQALVFTLLEKPDATLDDFADTACDHLDVDVTPQAGTERGG